MEDDMAFQIVRLIVGWMLIGLGTWNVIDASRKLW